MSSSEWQGWSQWEEAKEDFRPLWGKAHLRGEFKFNEEESSANSIPGLAEMSNPVQKARATAEAIVEEAKNKAESIEKEAFDKGFAQGERAGRQMIEESMGSALRALQEAVSQWKERAEGALEQIEAEAVRLSLEVAKKIVQREAQVDPDLVLQVIRAAIRSQPISGEITVRINPLDEETVREACGDIVKEFREIKGIRVEGDQGIQRGGALVECALGELDARIERQFQELERAFRRVLGPWAEQVQTETET